ncbi:dehydratase [Psittacicella gerlachiana]|uniref:Hotdog family 3-hydroxylacyl-ACP dehydratase n=1 Tax=Psittacicella gerlachiana TaxID=2028574 RepID=A0A3A1YF89_9GAMM|nr:dehydratase [Psittacicella gerlachiana]RIY36822.1 hypothetical protein CKF59_02085 [Psittacicella gerlachiana]
MQIDLTCPITNIDPLLPHTEQMILVDKVLDFGDDFIETTTLITPDNILLEDGVLENYSALEIMAQSIGCWAGCQSLINQREVGIGFFIGSRKINFFCSQILPNTQVTTKVKLSIQDQSGFGVFDVALYDSHTQKLLINGVFNVFSPKNREDYAK